MRFRDLPVVARVYIATVIVWGAVLAGFSIPRGGFERPLLLLSFVAGSIALNTIKIAIPAETSYSTLSFGFAVSFASLLVLGPAASVWTMLAGGWAQCTLNTKMPNPWYRTAFSMCALALSMEAAAATLMRAGGQNLKAPADIVIPAVVAAALVYFLANSILVAIALGLTSGRSIVKIWDQEFLWGAPNYFVGALAATVGVQSIARYGLESVVLLVAPLLLTHRLYKVYLGRVDRISRAHQELHTLYERAQADSLTDPLTELPNRRFLASHGPNELTRARREGFEVALLMVDIDEFKSINDVHGHHQGDLALRAVATSLRQGLRAYDVCGRYAGDEFVLILSRCDAALAARRAIELGEAVAAASASVSGLERPLSVSIGFAVFPSDGNTYDELLVAADSRMYAQKHFRSAEARPDQYRH